MSDSIGIAPSAQDDAADRRRRIMAIVGSSSGNLVEWYDFYCYAFFALYFAPVFFPEGDATARFGVLGADGGSCDRKNRAGQPRGAAGHGPWPDEVRPSPGGAARGE